VGTATGIMHSDWQHAQRLAVCTATGNMHSDWQVAQRLAISPATGNDRLIPATGSMHSDWQHAQRLAVCTATGNMHSDWQHAQQPQNQWSLFNAQRGNQWGAQAGNCSLRIEVVSFSWGTRCRPGSATYVHPQSTQIKGVARIITILFT
jgi:hypothetical protein